MLPAASNSPSSISALRLAIELLTPFNTSTAYISIANLPENDIKRKRTFSVMNGFA